MIRARVVLGRMMLLAARPVTHSIVYSGARLDGVSTMWDLQDDPQAKLTDWLVVVLRTTQLDCLDLFDVYWQGLAIDADAMTHCGCVWSTIEVKWHRWQEDYENGKGSRSNGAMLWNRWRSCYHWLGGGWWWLGLGMVDEDNQERNKKRQSDSTKFSWSSGGAMETRNIESCRCLNYPDCKQTIKPTCQ